MGTSPFYSDAKALFHKFSGSLYTERWGEIAAYLQDALPLFMFLRGHWDQVAFLRGMDDAASKEDGFFVPSFTKILSDSWFLAYWEMQLFLRKKIWRLLRWAEGCPCHESILSGHTSRMQEMQLRSQISVPKSVPCRCPAAGCRAAEMVDGKLVTFAEDLQSRSFNQMMLRSSVSLSSDSWDQLRQDWQRGSAYIVENLKLRLGFFQHLPWVILGGCHHKLDAARKQLQRAKALWDALPQGALAMQRPLCRQLFEEGELKQQLQGFLDGDSGLDSYPLLEAYLASLTFVQITERIIEAAHKELGSVSAQKSTTQYSIALRVPELISHLEKHPSSFASLVDSFTSARAVKKFADFFPGHGQHPGIVALGKRAKTEKVLVVLRRVLYRDTRIQHGDLKEAADVQAKAQKQVEKQIAAFKPKRQALSEEVIFAEACAKLLRDRCDEDPSQVVCIGNKFFMPLILRPSSIHRPAHAPGSTGVRGDKNEMLVSVLSNSGTEDAPTVSAMHDARSETLLLRSYISEQGLSTFLENFRFWSKPNSLLLTLPGTTALPIVMSELLTHLTSRACFDSKSAAVVPRASAIPAELEGVASILQRHEYLEENASGWFVTRRGIEMMQFAHALSSPCTVAMMLVDKPLDQLSLCELLVKAHAGGWIWKKPVSSKEGRAKLRYEVGAPLVWYAAGVTVRPEYLMCLLDAERLRTAFNINFIPHCAPDAVYELLWHGKPLDEALALVQDKSRKRKAMKAGLGSDVVVHQDDEQRARPKAKSQKRLALAAPVAAEADLVKRSGLVEHDGLAELAYEEASEDMCQGGSDDEEDDELLRELQELVENPESPDEAMNPESEQPASLQEPLPSVDPAARVDQGSGAGVRVVGDRVARERPISRPDPWGSFTFNRKMPRSAPPFGGLEAVCRFHALNAKTGCKKFVRFEGPTPEHEHKTLQILRRWCNMSKKFNRQRNHIRMPLRESDIPNSEVISQQQLTDDPPEIPVTDEELDRAARGIAPSNSGAAASARVKPKPKPTGKAKSKPKPKAKTPNACEEEACSEREPVHSPDSDAESDSSSSASSTSSSSSSSSVSQAE